MRTPPRVRIAQDFRSPNEECFSLHHDTSIEMASIEADQDFKWAYGWNRFNLRIIGVWPEPNEGPIMRYRSWVYVLLVFLVIYVPQTASIVVFWGDLNATIECLSTNVSVGISVMKLVIFSRRWKVLSTLLDLMSKDWNPSRTNEERESMREVAKIARAISVLSVSLTNSMFLAYVSMGVVQAFFAPSAFYGMRERNQPHNDSLLNPGFLYSSYFPFDTEDMARFVPAWLGQCVGTLMSMIAYSGPDSLIAMIVLHIVGQLSTIRIALVKLVDEETVKNSSIYWTKLIDIVKKHEELNRYAKTVEESFNIMLLAQMLVCTLTFCFQGFAMFTILIECMGTDTFPWLNVVFFIIYSFYTIIHLYIYCYVGDLLSVESTSISFAAYDCEWYRLSAKEARALMFITNRSRLPLELTAGKFCAFSLALFNRILKTSMGYLSVLLVMTDRLIE